MKDEVFLIDSNILVYAIDSSEPEKHSIAKDLLGKCFLGQVKYALSLQNLSEFFVVVTKKIKNPISHAEAADIVKKFIAFSGFVKFSQTAKSVSIALDLCVLNTSLSYWDALVGAVMIENGIFAIYTENTKDFSKIAGIKAINPFKR